VNRKHWVVIINPQQFRLLIALVIFFCAGTPTFAKDELSPKQARKLIAKTPGIALKEAVIRVQSVRAIDAATIQATAEIATAFRLQKNEKGQWRVAEVRTGQEQWESLALLFSALKYQPANSACDQLETNAKADVDPNNRKARCLLAELLNVQLPSDAVRIKDVSSLSLPFSSQGSSLVDALVTVDFQFTRGEKQTWRVSGVRAGNGNWIDPQQLSDALNAEKNAAARADLDLLAKALEQFRTKRGSYVEAKSAAVLVDFLSPLHLDRIIRLDPWRHPYVYEGSRNSFMLRSLGPDGRENTADDLVLSRPGSV